MAIKADEIIKLRNEGMSYALKVAREKGIDELARQVKMRGALRITPIVKEEELDRTIERLSETVYNNMLTSVYAVLHDVYGFGKARLHRFKNDFDRKVYLVGEDDPMGKHYAKFEDFAVEANRLYDLGIDLDVILQTQYTNDHGSRRYVAVDEAVKFLEKNGYKEAAERFKEETDDQKRKHLNKKERLQAECRRESDRRNKFWMDANEEESVEYWFNIFGYAMHLIKKFDASDVVDVWAEADRINGEIADGKETLESIKDKLIDSIEIQCDFTKAS